MRLVDFKVIILIITLPQYPTKKCTYIRRLVATIPLALSTWLLSACNPSPSTQSHDTAREQTVTEQQPKKVDSNNKDPLVGCYTVSRSEPAQIKIVKSGDKYAMQMREFNDPDKGWDKPEPMQVIANTNSEIEKYFDIKAGESKYLEKVIARPDRVFVLAKITDSFANLNPQYDSPYLGYIYKGSNTVYKVSCERTTEL